MAATPSLLVQYEVNNRGSTEVVTNRFHFVGGTPANAAAWEAFADAVVAGFHPVLNAACTIIGAVGYDAANDVAVFQKTYTQAGTAATGSESLLPGFCCALVRWATDQRTTKNHPIYLFSYVHGVINNGFGATSATQVQAAQLAALETWATHWWETGYSDGTNTYTRAGPNGAAATDSTVDSFVRDHDLHPR